MGEPYEKPEVSTVDLGNLIDEAERSAAEAKVSHERIRNRLESLHYEALTLEGDMAEAAGQLGLAKKALAKAQAIQEFKGEEG
jgi:hypothetical protein